MKKKYSVLLLYPDYIGDYGETFLSHVVATNPKVALKAARKEAKE